jgi:predicted transcriptional regulator
MEVLFTPELQEKLTRVASENQREPDLCVQELVAGYLDHDAWFRGKVTASVERLDRGEFLTQEEVAARLEEKFRPQCRFVGES